MSQQQTVLGKQVKVYLPAFLYRLLSKEAQTTGRAMAEIIREEVAQRYREACLAEYQPQISAAEVEA